MSSGSDGIALSNTNNDAEKPRYGVLARSKSAEDTKTTTTNELITVRDKKGRVTGDIPKLPSLPELSQSHISMTSNLYSDDFRREQYPAPSNSGVRTHRYDYNSEKQQGDVSIDGVSPIESHHRDDSNNFANLSFIPKFSCFGTMPQIEIEPRDLRALVRSQYIRDYSIVSILNEMVEALLRTKPEDPITFLINFLEEFDDEVKSTRMQVQRQGILEMVSEKRANLTPKLDTQSTTSDKKEADSTCTIVVKKEIPGLNQGQPSGDVATAASSPFVETSDNNKKKMDNAKHGRIDDVRDLQANDSVAVGQKEVHTIIVDKEQSSICGPRATQKETILPLQERSSNIMVEKKETDVIASRSASARKSSVVRVTHSGRNWYIPTIDSELGGDLSDSSNHGENNENEKENLIEDDISVVLQDMAPMKILMDALHRDGTPMISICLELARKNVKRAGNQKFGTQQNDTLGIELLKRACCGKRCPTLYSLYQSHMVPPVTAITIPNYKSDNDIDVGANGKNYRWSSFCDNENKQLPSTAVLKKNSLKLESSLTHKKERSKSNTTIIVQDPYPIRCLLRAARIQATPKLGLLINHAVATAEESARQQRRQSVSTEFVNARVDPMNSAGIMDITGLSILQQSSMQGFKILGCLTNHWMVREQIVLAVRP